MKKLNFKKLKFGINNTIVVVFAVVLVLLCNMLANILETKIPSFKLDLTENAVTKIGSETKSVLKKIDQGDEEIELIYLSGTSELSQRVKDVLEQYDAYSENISFRVENYHTNPLILSGYSISAEADVDGSVIVATKDKSRVRMVAAKDMEITYNNSTVFLLENLLTNAIGVVASEKQMNVCFAAGHDEAVGEMLVNLLKSENISVSQLDLSTGEIPPEIDLFMIMAPQKDYTSMELNVIDNYLLSGGNVAISLPFGIQLPRLEEYVADWGISAKNDIILEQSAANSYQQSGMYFYPTLGEAEAVGQIEGRILASYARSLTCEKVGDIEAEVILKTSAQGYSVPIKNGQPDSENMTPGQFDIGYILEKPLNGSFEETAKLIVTGTPSVWGVTDNIVTEYDYHVYYSLAEDSFGNGEFVMNMLSDVYGETIQSIYVPIKSRKVSILTLSETEATVLKHVFCTALPVIVLLCGIIVWLKRRNK